MISKNYRFIIIVPPRTGSHSIKHTIRNLNSTIFQGDLGKLGSSKYPHRPIRDFKLNLQNFEEYRVVGVIRNPWDRISSYWHRFYKPDKYNIKRGIKEERRPKVSFNDFVRTLHNHPDSLRFFGDMINHFFSVDNKLIVKEYIRFDHLQEDFNKFCETKDLPPTKLKHINGCKKMWKDYDPRSVYDSELVDIIRKRYKTEIEHFGYEF